MMGRMRVSKKGKGSRHEREEDLVTQGEEYAHLTWPPGHQPHGWSDSSPLSDISQDPGRPALFLVTGLQGSRVEIMMGRMRVSKKGKT